MNYHVWLILPQGWLSKMPTFSYKAVRHDGKGITGSQDALNIYDLESKLEQTGTVLISAKEKTAGIFARRKKITPKPALNIKTPAERKETLTAQNRDVTGRNIPKKPKKKKKKKDDAIKASDSFPVFGDDKKKKPKKRTGETEGSKETKRLLANLSPAVLENMKRIEALNQTKIETEKDNGDIGQDSFWIMADEESRIQIERSEEEILVIFEAVDQGEYLKVESKVEKTK